MRPNWVAENNVGASRFDSGREDELKLKAMEEYRKYRGKMKAALGRISLYNKNAANKVKSMVQAHEILYILDDYDFETVTRRALIQNVKEGKCKLKSTYDEDSD